MANGGRGNLGPAGKFPSPQESRLSVGQNSPSASLENLAPGLVNQSGFDGGSFDYDSPFADEATFGGKTNSTASLAEQMRLLSETPIAAAEQMGMTIPRAESSRPKSGDIFSGKDYKREKNLNQFRQQNPEIGGQVSERFAHDTIQLTEKAQKSSTRLSAEAYAEIRAQKTAEQRAKLASMQKSQEKHVGAGGLNLTHNATANTSSAEQTLLQIALKRFNQAIRRDQRTAASLAAARRSKLAAHRGGMEGMKERSSSVSSLEFAQSVSSHEWAGQDMGD